jgi:hypothetical protein
MSLKRRIAGTSLIFLINTAAAQASWREQFAAPPDSAKPRVWWHWMNGNISAEGIRLDLEWMQRVGIGGVQTFDADLHTPLVVPQRRDFMSEAWRQDFHFASEEAQRLGLELAIASSPGWSSAGGPWVRPEQAMKKLVWSASAVDGGRHVTLLLPAPPAVAGPYQDIPAAMMAAGPEAESAPFYRDARVIAFPSPAEAAGPPAVVTASTGAIDQHVLSDGRLDAAIPLPAAADPEGSWLRFDYAGQRTVYAVTVTHPGPRGFGAPPLPVMTLQASDDGAHFDSVATLAFGAGPQQTASFAPRRARSWRLLVRPEAGGGPGPAAPGVVLPPFGAPASSYAISEVRLHEQPRIHRYEDKAGFAAASDYDALATPQVTASQSLPHQGVIDLTGAMRADGTLEWDAPAGRWTVLRMGYSLTGHRNGPASPDATGLEVDKLSATHVDSYLDHYLGLYAGNPGLKALLNDSIESGAQNWTDDMPQAFRARRGYALEAWLPALTGQIVDSAAASDRFLWDFRRTIAELLAERYYGGMARQAHARGLVLYGEALEDRRPQLGDDLEMRRRTDVPMAAMWYFGPGEQPRPTYAADIRGAASVAHVWGQNLVAAESMTAFGRPWMFSPRDLKATADMEFALGVNRIVIHTSAHQPLADSKPGLSLAPFLGQYFTRNETWAAQAAPWISYLARNSLMLQQGRQRADIAFFYGEEGPLTALYGERPNGDVPDGYAYDYVNQEALLQRLEVQRGDLVTPSGARYRLLYLGGASKRMTLATLRRIAQLVRAGATVVGDAPIDSPSLADDMRAHARLRDQLWNADSRQRAGKAWGKGRVLSGRTLEQALRQLAIAPDFHGGALSYVHRQTAQDEIYFVSNGTGGKVKVDASFRVHGRQPEFWYADRGASAPAPYRMDRARTTVPLELEANGSVFVVFSRKTQQQQRSIAAPRETTLLALQDRWSVSFEPGRGAPAGTMDIALGSLAASDNPGVRYFSGTASYTRQLQLEPATLAQGRIVLDLGEVRDIAQVLVNGIDQGISWKPPYRLDVTKALRPGANVLEVRVTNPWANRLIGDAQPGARKVASGTGPVFRADAPLLPAGLIGPVLLQSVDAPLRLNFPITIRSGAFTRTRAGASAISPSASRTTCAPPAPCCGRAC